jgi:PAS domain S-box-containing protein
MQWTKLKTIIGACDCRDDKFLSLINDNGVILNANANMKRKLKFENPKKYEINFFDLLHPVNLDEFKQALHHSSENNRIASAEIFIKNGYFLPMKWEISKLDNGTDDKTYLCIGHKIVDDKRLKKFTDLGGKNYQLIVEGLNAGVLFQDKEGEIISVNHKTAEIFDTTLEKLYQLLNLPKLWNTLWTVNSEDGDPILFEDTPFMKAITTGTTQTEVLVVTLRNGENKWLHFSSQPLFEGTSNNAYAVVSNILDLTYEKKLIGKVREGKAVFRSFLEHTPNLAWVVDEDANLVFASKSFYDYLHIDEKKAQKNKITDLVPAAVASALFDKHVEVLETGLAAELIEKVKLVDGTDFIFHVNIFPIPIVSGKKLLGGQAVNMADKFATEQKLREVNERLLLLTRTTSDCIWEWDMQTGHIFRNDALMDMVGYQHDNPKGLSWWLRRIHPEDRNRISDKVKFSTEKNLQSWEDEYRFKCADGTYKHMRDRGYIVYENGLPVKMIGSLQDVTNLKDLESKLMEEKLERQQEISETVIQAQERERTHIGHELHDNVNQILSSAKLFIETIKTTDKDDIKLKAKGVEYISLAIEEIRKLSKELAVPQLKEKGLVASIETLIEDVHFSNALKVKFTHDSENDLISQGKKVTLFRILQEQMKNILKHSHAKNAEIFLQVKENNVLLVVKDDGVGFDSKITHRGIGLSNIHERTRFYNGSVEIQTAPGKGCCLIASIPTF